jgi:HK97 family phage prohead protease
MKENGNQFFKFSGYASTFGNIDRVNDVVVRGAFIESLKEMMPILLWQHEWHEPVGVFLKCQEEEKGLYVEAKMPLDDDFVRGRVVPQMKVGSIKSMSIGYSTENYTYDENSGITYLNKLKLWEVSLVTIPANSQAVITDMKSLKDVSNIRELEAYLKNSGHSRKECVIIISKLKEFMREARTQEQDDQRDAGLKNLFEGIANLKFKSEV